MNKMIRKIGVSVTDTEEQVLKINSLVILALSLAVAGIVWGGMYCLLGYFIPALFPIFYSTAILVVITFFYFNKSFRFLLNTKLFLILLTPFLLQMKLGGFMPSGAVLFWSLLAPIGALMFAKVKEAVLWFFAFIILFVLCLFCGHINAFEYVEIPEVTQHIFLGMNITGVAIVSFITTTIFVKGLQKEQSKNKLLIKLKNEQEKEIKDSIHYAKYIQESLLANPTDIKSHFDDSFILSKPKDIVSGDFYWVHKDEDRIMLAVADATGHGVPGAMVSLVCSNALNSSVIEHELLDPDKILDRTRQTVIESFTGKHNVSVGMDISFCNFNEDKSLLCFSGALNSIYIVRDKKLIELKGDRFPIGKHESKIKKYSKQIVDLNKGDCIYMFSDGYFDQFGGSTFKKMKSSRFKKLLVSIAHLEMHKQKVELDQFFKDWKGDLDQIDDVLIVGIRV